jgi:hypothetical protein
MNLIEYPLDPPRPMGSGLFRMPGWLRRRRPSKEARQLIADRVDTEQLASAEGEIRLLALERNVVLADGQIRAEHYLIDQQNKNASLTAIRKKRYDAEVAKAQANEINDFLRRTEELLLRYDDPALRAWVEQERRLFFVDRCRQEIN